MTKLGTKLANDPKIKVVTLLEFYNFVLGCTTMQVSKVMFNSSQTYNLKMKAYTITMT